MHLKDFLPPVAMRGLSKLRPRQYGWFGNYATWEDAVRDSSGYDADEIAERVLASALKVKRGEAAYERDSVLFDTIQYSWPLLSGLLWVAARSKGSLNVLDIGGGYGSSYMQNLKFISSIESLHWNIVEQEKFVRLGKEHFQNEQLRFYTDLDSCIHEQHVNVALLSCVLPYVERPYELVEKLFSLRIPYIILDRMPFMPERLPHRLTIHVVDPSIYKATIPTHIFSEHEFLTSMQKNYSLVTDFRSDLEFELADGTRIPNKGFIFQIKL